MAKHLIPALLALSVLCVPALGFAQDSTSDDGGAALSAATSTTTGVITTVVAIPLGIISTSTSSLRGPRRRHHRRMRRRAMMLYLEHNTQRVDEGLAVGGGDALDDLATLCEVPEGQRATFHHALRQHRAALLPLLRTSDMQQRDAMVSVLFHLATEVS